jgi:hypothetical protein
MTDRLSRWMLALLICAAGCRGVGSGTSPATAPATVPATAPGQFCSVKYGFSMQPPAGWSQIKGAADEPISLVPQSQAGAKDLSLVPSLKMAVPDLPPHIPGMIPLGSVADGYVDDLRKQYPDLKVDERVVVSIPSASARRIVSSYHRDGTAWRDIVLCIVHKDRVFLLSADCPAGDYPATRAAFDLMATSLKWN